MTKSIFNTNNPMICIRKAYFIYTLILFVGLVIGVSSGSDKRSRNIENTPYSLDQDQHIVKDTVKVKYETSFDLNGDGLDEHIMLLAHIKEVWDTTELRIIPKRGKTASLLSENIIVFRETHRGDVDIEYPHYVVVDMNKDGVFEIIVVTYEIVAGYPRGGNLQCYQYASNSDTLQPVKFSYGPDGEYLTTLFCREGYYKISPSERSLEYLSYYSMHYNPDNDETYSYFRIDRFRWDEKSGGFLRAGSDFVTLPDGYVVSRSDPNALRALYDYFPLHGPYRWPGGDFVGERVEFIR